MEILKDLMYKFNVQFTIPTYVLSYLSENFYGYFLELHILHQKVIFFANFAQIFIAF